MLLNSLAFVDPELLGSLRALVLHPQNLDLRAFARSITFLGRAHHRFDPGKILLSDGDRLVRQGNAEALTGDFQSKHLEIKIGLCLRTFDFRLSNLPSGSGFSPEWKSLLDAINNIALLLPHGG